MSDETSSSRARVAAWLALVAAAAGLVVWMNVPPSVPAPRRESVLERASLSATRGSVRASEIERRDLGLAGTLIVEALQANDCGRALATATVLRRELDALSSSARARVQDLADVADDARAQCEPSQTR